MKYGIVIRYEFDTAWLRLGRDERNAKEEVFQKEIVGPFADRLSVRHFDAEAFAADYSDFLIVETDDLKSYYYFIEKLRDSEFVARGWVRIKDISIGLQDGYKEYEKETDA
ncbi:darcynin family protein [Streptomyces sp. NPDC052676]|uniref:darcynin family protein n=1 Tax=Streptomyces sp. NPDC052676 TaxID=3154953 RepID=UPI003417AF67